MRIIVDRRWRVHASAAVDVPLSATAMWAHMVDVRRFLTMDPLHVAAQFPDVPPGATPPVNARLIVRHRLMGFGVDRVGRMLRWREGRGFVFSDLSHRGMRVGFPHVCAYELERLSATTSRLHVSARGRWTATWMPRWLVRLWLWWVMNETHARLTREFTRGPRGNRRPPADMMRVAERSANPDGSA